MADNNKWVFLYLNDRCILFHFYREWKQLKIDFSEREENTLVMQKLPLKSYSYYCIIKPLVMKSILLFFHYINGTQTIQNRVVLIWFDGLSSIIRVQGLLSLWTIAQAQGLGLNLKHFKAERPTYYFESHLLFSLKCYQPLFRSPI